MKYSEKENLYMQAKSAYYNGDPIMSDDAFDVLESELRELNSEVLSIVGTGSKSGKVKHISPMGSLAKIQFKKDYQPTKEFISFLNRIKNEVGDAEIEFTLKYDGNSCNLIYEKIGNTTYRFTKAITRGDGGKGQDLTEKVKNLIPTTFEHVLESNLDKLPLPEKIEIRGELLMKNEIFNTYYSEYKNPRNFVAGLLGRDEISYENLDRLTFVAFEIREHFVATEFNHAYWDYPSDSTGLLLRLGFNEKVNDCVVYDMTDTVSIVSIYEEFLKYRADSEFLTDGFVCKTEEKYRKQIGETSHHPKWALAIKFPPKSAITRVVDVEWNLGKTGQLTPVGILEPVDLDSTTVSRVTLHNYEWILNKKVAPGAKVEIVKSGDIIPAIVDVLEESEADFDYPKFYEGLPTKIVEGKHLVVEDFETLPEFGGNALHRACSVMELDYFGPAMCQRLFDAGISDIRKIFDENLMNGDYLSKNGSFNKGTRELQRILDEVQNFKEVDLWKVINSLQFTRVGKSLSKEVAFLLSGIVPDFGGYEKAVVAEFSDLDNPYVTKILAFIDILERKGVKILTPEENKNSNGNLEFTGSPKEFGFKTKAEFVQFISDKGLSHEKLTKDSSYLVTDSHDSSSSKMKKANKLEVTIVTYGELIDILK